MDTTTPAGSALDAISVVSPCTVDWDAMTQTSDARSRHCGECRLDVFDLSTMTRPEAEAFLASRVPGARLCVKFQKRADGRVITADCVTARQKIARRAKRVKAAASALLAMVLPALAACGGATGTPTPTIGTPPLPPAPEEMQHIKGDYMEPRPQPAPEPTPMMGICAPEPVPPAPEQPTPPAK